MQKLRDDIPFNAAWVWANGLTHGRLLALQDLYSNIPRDDYPKSFYEAPPIGSFGKFKTDLGGERWGFLREIDKDNNGEVFYVERDSRWTTHTFTPCLPQDVDENGYPKEDV